MKKIFILMLLAVLAPVLCAKQTYPAAAETYPGETYPSETYPGETYPGDTYPSETYPGETYPSDTYPSVTYPGETYPGEAATYPSAGKTYPGELDVASADNLRDRLKKAVKESSVKKEKGDVLLKDFIHGVKSFRSYISKAKELDVMLVLQYITELMDDFNAAVAKDPEFAQPMAKEFAAPIKAGWGEELEPIAFIKDNVKSINSESLQAELKKFASDLEEYSR